MLATIVSRILGWIHLPHTLRKFWNTLKKVIYSPKIPLQLFCHRVWHIPFFTVYKYHISFVYQKSPNTEYRILFGSEKILILNTEYYSVLKKSESRIWIVLIGLSIWIPNNKYWIRYKSLEKKAKKINIFVSNKTFSFLNIGWNYSDRYSNRYLNTRIVFGVPQIPNTEYCILFGIEIIQILITNTTTRSNYLNSIWIPNYCSHPVLQCISWNFYQKVWSAWKCSKSLNILHKLCCWWCLWHFSILWLARIYFTVWYCTVRSGSHMALNVEGVSHLYILRNFD